MRRCVISFVAALLLIAALGVAPAAAVECESGQMFAQDHIVPAARAGLLGGAMNPGMHRGYSVCVR